jgi:hypothetical protein
MKPHCHFHPNGTRPESGAIRRQFPATDYFFQSRIEEWRGFSSPHDGGESCRNFRRLSREYYGAAAREHLREMIAFGVVIAASAWLVLYMVIVVVRLLSKQHP